METQMELLRTKKIDILVTLKFLTDFYSFLVILNTVKKSLREDELERLMQIVYMLIQFQILTSHKAIRTRDRFLCCVTICFFK